MARNGSPIGQIEGVVQTDGETSFVINTGEARVLMALEDVVFEGNALMYSKGQGQVKNLPIYDGQETLSADSVLSLNVLSQSGGESPNGQASENSENADVQAEIEADLRAQEEAQVAEQAEEQAAREAQEAERQAQIEADLRAQEEAQAAEQAAREAEQAAREAEQAERQTQEEAERQAQMEANERARQEAEAAEQAAEQQAREADLRDELDRVARDLEAAREEAAIAMAEARNAQEEQAATQAEFEAQRRAQMLAEQAAREAEERAREQAQSQAAQSDAESSETTQTREQVTRSDVRAADEDYARDRSSRDMSDFEKALLLGLGAIAVGEILDSGDKVVVNTGDRIVLEDRQTGQLRVLKNDDALLRQPGADVRTQTYSDGSTRTTVTRQSGVQIITVRAPDGRVIRRERVETNGQTYVLFDDTRQVEPVDVRRLPERPAPTIVLRQSDISNLERALSEDRTRIDRRFSLSQIREIPQVRALAPEIDLAAITFATGSAAIQSNQARELAALGEVIVRMIERNPYEMFLIEGHTDAVGSASSNLTLSDRRAETVALALTQYFNVPPENLITQGYGEMELKVPTLGDERANRRVAVRRITNLLD
jgi:outer membrane protein OmpA-like peptidoglycan-associated protein